jgi:DNA-binding NarL/FixJ family response regulator
MYTTHFDANDVFDALRAGAKGYILKGGDPLRLVEDIFEMAAGGSPMSSQISRLVTNSFHQGSDKNEKLDKLTKQEWEVLKSLDKGLSYKEIAAEKFVSPHTVRSQLRSIYEKLHVHTKLEAVNLLRKN